MFRLKNNTRGFTLIELLVVITIIGILATGGVSVFTTQLQKARDSSRQSDIKQYQVAAEQYLSDNQEYPAEVGFTGSVAKYLSVLTEDPKAGLSVCSGTGGSTAMPIATWATTAAGRSTCNYAYWRADNADGVTNAAFKLGTAFENDGNIRNFASNKADGGANDGIFEVFAGGSGGLIPLANSSPAGTLIRK